MAGELEHAIVTCDKEKAPDLIILEGQSALLHPRGLAAPSSCCPAGQGRRPAVRAGREFYDGLARIRLLVPPIDDDIELIRLYGARTRPCPDGEGLGSDALIAVQRTLRDRLGLPV